LRKLLLLTHKWPDRQQTFKRWTPGQCAFRVCSRSRSRSKVMWYGHFCAGTKIASSPRQMAGSLPNLHTMDSRSACIQGVLKVKVKGHVIRALPWILGMSYSIIDGLVKYFWALPCPICDVVFQRKNSTLCIWDAPLLLLDKLHRCSCSRHRVLNDHSSRQATCWLA